MTQKFTSTIDILDSVEEITKVPIEIERELATLGTAYQIYYNNCRPIIYVNVTPKYVVVPNNGAPGNPSKASLNRLADYKVKVYRQSDSKTGNILITSDGKNITFKMDVS